MPRRNRIDSIDGQLKVARGAGRVIDPPSNVPLEAGDMSFFASVLGEFARSEWTAHQLELAAMLARCMADFEREQSLLRVEGSVCATDRGTPVVNPRKTVVQMLAGTILSMRRSLQLHARAQNGEAEKTGPRRVKAKELEASLQTDDALLN